MLLINHYFADFVHKESIAGVILDIPVCILSVSLTFHWPVIESLTGDCLLQVSETRLIYLVYDLKILQCAVEVFGKVLFLNFL